MVAEMTGKSKLCQQIEEEIQWLSQFGADERNGVTRLLYTDEWYSAQEALQNKMKQLQLETYYDDVGNLFGRLNGTCSAKEVILVGSHVDTVKYGGKYDGAFGIIAGIIAAGYLKKKYGLPKKTIEVVSLCEEEGSRFPITYWGSGNINGIYDITRSTKIIDQHAISLQQAMHRLGFGNGTYIKPVRDDITHFIELHIEQGKQLEKSGLDIGIVSSIVGQKRFTVSVTGESNHAGTTPMKHRKDALFVSCQLITQLIELSKRYNEHLYVTIGKLNVTPNIANVIPGSVQFSIDVRHHEQEILEEVETTINQLVKKIMQKSDMKIEIDRWMSEKPVRMDNYLSEISKNISSEKNMMYMELVSGAGHDSQVFGQFTPTCLLFVPSQGGISHSPKEYTSGEQLEKGVKLLIDLLYKLAY
ncbi:allantoate deiminase [Priestia megaterium]|nr:allantoate deiminase [Priestia megaterium]